MSRTPDDPLVRQIMEIDERLRREERHSHPPQAFTAASGAACAGGWNTEGTITNGSAMGLTWTNSDYLSGMSIHSSGGFVIPVNGIYRLSLAVVANTGTGQTIASDGWVRLELIESAGGSDTFAQFAFPYLAPDGKYYMSKVHTRDQALLAGDVVNGKVTNRLGCSIIGANREFHVALVAAGVEFS